MVRRNNMKKYGFNASRIATILLAFLLATGLAIPVANMNMTGVYAADPRVVGSWDELREAVRKASDGDTITLSKNIVMDNNNPITVSEKAVTITGTNVSIYQGNQDRNGKYQTMFTVMEGGNLTIDSGVTLSAKKISDESSEQCPDLGETPTYTSENFTGNLTSNGKDYDPKGFFIHVEEKGSATLKGTISDFVTSREKSTTPRYVAPVVANGDKAYFNIEGGTIKNNLVGYIVKDQMADKDAHTIKLYVKGAGPNVPRVPNAETQKANIESFDRARNKDADIDEGVPGTGITGTAGAIIYKGGAKGEFTGATITNNRADTGGVMVSGKGTQLTINDSSSKLTKNVGVQFGGATTAEQGGTITMQDGDMSENAAWFGGGAVYATENGIAWLLGLMNGSDGLSPQFDDRLAGRFEMFGGSLHDNTALTRGGAILADSDGVQITKGKLYKNMSRMLGGAVYVMGDHPLYTYTMHLTSLFVHDNVAVSGVVPGDKANDNSKLQTKLSPPSACADASGDLFTGTISENTDDMNDGWGTHGTGGGLWLCAYGNTVFSAGATQHVVIANNYATGTAPLNNPVYTKWIRTNSEAQKIRDDIEYNSATSYATTTGKTGGNDIHADTGDSGKVTISDLTQYNGWFDENASETEDVPYTSEVSDGRINLINKGKVTTMTNPSVEVYENISRRGGGLAADGTYLLGPQGDQSNMEASMGVVKEWENNTQKKPVTIRVSASANGKTAFVADVPLDGIANSPISEFDSVEELAPTANTWNGRFSLPLELTASDGSKIPVFKIVANYTDFESESIDEFNNEEINPLSADGKSRLAQLIKQIKLDYTSQSGEVDYDAVMAAFKDALTITFNNKLKFTAKELEMVYDSETDSWSVKEEGGEPVESTSYVFKYDDVDLSKIEYTLQSTPYYEKVVNPQTGELEDKEVFQVHLFGVNLVLSMQNDNQPITEKYVNKEVHSDIVNFDQDFEYDIMAYVPVTAEEFTISDTLVNGLEFADASGNASNDAENVVRAISVKTINNHEPGEEGSVSLIGEPDRNGKILNLKPGGSADIPDGKGGGKKVAFNTQAKLLNEKRTLTVTIPKGDTLDILKGKWVQLTFGARIQDKYRNIEALKDLESNVDGKINSWEGTDIDKKGSPQSVYTVANGDKAIVAPILSKVGPDPVIWAVEAPSRLFARTAKGDYYATPFEDKSGNTWERLDKELNDDEDKNRDKGYGKSVWINADNRYNGRAPHANNTKRKIGLEDSELTKLKEMPLIQGSAITKAAEGASRYFAEVTDAEGKKHIWATAKGDLSSLTWHEVTNISSDEYKNAVKRLSNDRYTIRMLDLEKDDISLDPDAETGKNWPVISEEKHEGMANQASYSVKFGNNAEAKTYKTNTVTVKPETTELKVEKLWDADGEGSWPDEVKNVTFNVYSVKNDTEKQVYVDADGNVVGSFAESDTKPDGATPLTVVLTKDNKNTIEVDESRATVKGLPKLKQTVYTARETKITYLEENQEKIVDVDYKDSAKTYGVTKLGENGKTVVTGIDTEYKGGGANFTKLATSETKPVRGAIADNRLWAMLLDGRYFFTADGDTDGSSEESKWTLISDGDENYERAQQLLGMIDSQGRFTEVKVEKLDNDKIEELDQTIGTPTETKVFDIIPSVTAANSTSSIEKYVNNDVHSDLGEFDKAFKYDILVYVPAGSTELTITDPLRDGVLEFAKKKDSLDAANMAAAEKAVAADETIAAIVAKAKNNHTADSTVAGKDSDNEGTDITSKISGKSIEDNTLTIKFEGKADTEHEGNKLPLDFAGKWVQVTFWAKYTDEIIKAAEAGEFAGEFDKIRENGAVISEKYPGVAEDAAAEKFSHEGTANKASAAISINNEQIFKLNSNKVTVKPGTEKLWVQKKWQDENGKELAKWPNGMKVNINVYKNVEGSEAEVVENLEVSSFEPVSSKTYPKLVGVTYSVDEVEVPEKYAKLDEITGDGSEEKPFVITNAARKYTGAEITKKWVGATMDEIPSGEDFKTYLVLKDGEGKDVSEEYADKLTVTAKGNTYKAKWVGLPDGKYTVEEKAIPGFDTEVNGSTITNKKKPSEEKPEIEKYVNQAVHKDIELDEVFTYDIIAYVTKDADSVKITDKLHDMLTFEGDSSDVSVVDLGEADNHLVTNNVSGVKVNDKATVAKEGKIIDGTAVSFNDQVLTVFITNTLKKSDAVYDPVQIDNIDPSAEGYYEKDGEDYKLTTDTSAQADKQYYEERYKAAENIKTGDDVSGGYYEKDGDVYKLTEDVTAENGKTYYERVFNEVTIEFINPSQKGYYEKDGETYKATTDAIADPGKQYYVKSKEETGYEYDEDEDQPVTALRGHWIKVTFKARINDKTLEEVKKAYQDISASDVDDERDPENVGNAPVISAENHTGIPNDASYTIGVANEAGIKEDVHVDRSNVVTVKPKEKKEDEVKPDDEDNNDVKDVEEKGSKKIKSANTGDETPLGYAIFGLLGSAAALELMRRRRMS